MSPFILFSMALKDNSLRIPLDKTDSDWNIIRAHHIKIWRIKICGEILYRSPCKYNYVTNVFEVSLV